MVRTIVEWTSHRRMDGFKLNRPQQVELASGRQSKLSRMGKGPSPHNPPRRRTDAIRRRLVSLQHIPIRSGNTINSFAANACDFTSCRTAMCQGCGCSNAYVPTSE